MHKEMTVIASGFFAIDLIIFILPRGRAAQPPDSGGCAGAAFSESSCYASTHGAGSAARRASDASACAPLDEFQTSIEFGDALHLGRIEFLDIVVHAECSPMQKAYSEKG
jgi:hypothetical protein